MEGGVPGAVPLEGGAVAVVGEAVRLDDQGAVTPEKVDLVGSEPRVDLGLGEAVAAAEGEEAALELAAGQLVGAAQVARVDQAEIQSSPDGPTVNRLGSGAVQSRRVRFGVLIAMPLRRVRKAAVKVEERCRVMHLRLSRPPSPCTVISMRPSCGGSMPQSEAALRWLTAALPPTARTAARQRPWIVRRGGQLHRPRDEPCADARPWPVSTQPAATSRPPAAARSSPPRAVGRQSGRSRDRIWRVACPYGMKAANCRPSPPSSPVFRASARRGPSL